MLFRSDLYEKLGVPVGIIDCNLGGSSASAWTCETWLAKDPDVRSYLDDYNRNVSQLDLESYNRNCLTLMQMMTANPMPVDPEKESDSPFDLSALPAEMLEVFQCVFLNQGPRSPFGHPGSLYENMLSTFIPYSAKGVIFYQGESDDVKARIYAKLFSLMISNWREAFANEDLYFLFVQLAAYGREGNPGGDMYAILRDQQTLVSRTTRNTGMAVAMDVGHFHDIHPRRKIPVGKRLALVAREKVYGEQVESSGPVYRDMQVVGNKLILAFDHAAAGLACKGEKLQGFQICGANRLYVSADARIIGSTVELSSPAVPVPAAASYGWANYMEVNLYNAEGLPAVPFKTDKYL